MDVPGQGRGPRVLRRQGVQGFLGLGNGLAGLVRQLVQAGLYRPVANIALGVPVQQGPEHWQQGDDQEPGELRRGVHGAAQQAEDHDGGEDGRPTQDMGEKCLKPLENTEKYHHLESQEEHDEPQAAEHNPEKALLALPQQGEAVAVKMNLHSVAPILICCARAYLSIVASCPKMSTLPGGGAPCQIRRLAETE